jgi:hypothetical protein
MFFMVKFWIENGCFGSFGVPLRLRASAGEMRMVDSACSPRKTLKSNTYRYVYNIQV